MAIVAIFLLGIGNFAMHKAVLESGHRMLSQVPGYVHMLGGKAPLLTEFLVLLAAMLLASTGWTWVLWAYCGYSALNGIAAWLILTDRL
tara:strand:+ start:456 stop:722 length:267 start_codon:yes stop_codon:yes gene_type:complete